MRIRSKVLVCVLTCAIATGSTAVRAAEKRQTPTMNIRILNNSEFDREHGVTSGKGTKSNPYVISGLELNSLHIENTSKWVDIKKNTIAGVLLLDWIGGAKVHYNTIGQLVANRNVERTGMPTTGTIVHNTIGSVQQLRHWDGVFAYNTVGNAKTVKQRAANLDGFNGARYERNRFYGFVDARLHGHHHSSSFGGDSHMHAGHHHGKGVDHTQRYHQVSLANNTIYADHTYALAYLDSGHAGNDRTAPSETDEALNLPHAHHTKVRFAGNKLMGAGILVDVFNANDQHHVRTYRGSLDIDSNSITLGKDDFLSARQLIGIDMRNATDVTTRIRKNKITGWKPSSVLKFLENWDTDAGILLQNVDKTDVWIVGNSVANRHYGVRATNFTVSARWFIGSLKTTNVKEPVSYQNVPRKPQAA
jgi:hypothetical protein